MKTDKWLWAIAIVVGLMIFVLIYTDALGNDISDECYAQLEMSNELIEELDRDNEILRSRINILEEQIRDMEETINRVDDKTLLNQCLIQLKVSEDVINELVEESNYLAYLYKDSQEQVNDLKRYWQIGGGVSYPAGGSVYVGYIFRRFGLFGMTGYINNGMYVQAGMFFRK